MYGFLVVMADIGESAYKGVDRVPPYPAEFPEEADAAEVYALGSFKDQATNLIETHERATALLQLFARSVRSFEIILCHTEDLIPNGPLVGTGRCYGYDVAAVPADYWSIVRDMSRSSWATAYRLMLNEFGLFGDRSTAEAYLRDYRANKEPDADSPLLVVRIEQVASTEAGLV
jgi:hypothetical protein